MITIRKTTVLIFLVVHTVGLTVCAQNFKSEKRIFLWDVTLSTFGFNGSPDIAEEVRENLLNAIENLQDENNEIVVIPFQDKVLDVWEGNAGNSDKGAIISNIQNIKEKDLDVTMTNICEAWGTALEYLDNSKRNYIFLLTDGAQNSSKLPKTCLVEKISNWCEVAKDNDGFAYYVMLTDAAKIPELEEVINQCNRIEIVPGTNIDIVELGAQSKQIHLNVQEDQLISELRFSSNKAWSNMDNIEINCRLDENEYFQLQTHSVSLSKEGEVNFEFNTLMPIDEIRSRLPRESSIPLHLSIDNAKHPRVYITSGDIELLVKNEREKILTIEIAD